MKFGIERPERTRSVIMFGPTGLSRARLPVKIWVTKVMTKRSANALEDDLTAKSIRPERTGESFGTYDRELARSMALCTRYFRVDRSLGIYNQETQRVDYAAGLKVLKKFFLAERKSWQARLKVPSLLIFGEHELSLNPYKICEKAQRNIPGIETAVIKHAGHGAIFDQPEKVATMMREFVYDRVLRNSVSVGELTAEVGDRA
jgi:pimeloyl-ACP methyl ester carboxylesterase